MKKGINIPQVDSCVTEAIERAVRADDLREWAARPDQPIPNMTYQEHPQPSRPLMHHLLYQWLP